MIIILHKFFLFCLRFNFEETIIFYQRLFYKRLIIKFIIINAYIFMFYTLSIIQYKNYLKINNNHQLVNFYHSVYILLSKFIGEIYYLRLLFQLYFLNQHMKEAIQNQGEGTKTIKDTHKNTKKQDKKHIAHEHGLTSCTQQKIKQQIKKRNHYIEKLYKRSTVNKIYLFPKQQQRIQDISLSSHSSIEQMKTIQIYRLEQQNKNYRKQNETLRSIRNQSKTKQSNDIEKLEQKIRKIKMNSKKILNNSHNFDSQTNLDSKRLNESNKSSGILINTKQKPKKIQKSDKLIPTEKNIKNKKQVHFYQELNSNVDLNSKLNCHKPRDKNNSCVENIKVHHPVSNKSKMHVSHNSVENKSKETLKKHPYSNLCLSKIFQKYHNLAKKSARSRTQH